MAWHKRKGGKSSERKFFLKKFGDFPWSKATFFRPFRGL
jgi:hypothetical protein